MRGRQHKFFSIEAIGAAIANAIMMARLVERNKGHGGTIYDQKRAAAKGYSSRTHSHIHHRYQARGFTHYPARPIGKGRA